MPPWLPQLGYGQFQDERRLTAQQIETIAAWVAAGTPEGNARDLPPEPPARKLWQLGTPDLVISAAAPFRVPPSGSDVFWNFTFAPNLAATRYARAIEIHPGGSGTGATEASRLIHHANVLLDRTGSSARFEAKPGAGFPGMEISLDRNPLDPESTFLFWKPGSEPYSEPDGLSWRLDPGNTLVLNTHIQPSGKSEEIQPTIGLYFTGKPPTRFPLLIELENDKALDIPPGARNFEISDDFSLPMDVDVLAIYPHAHYLGKRLEAYATLRDGSKRWLIRIPDWNFNWQAVYRYRAPVFLPKGSTISMRFSYDNSSANIRNPSDPPRRVQAGNRATDEMGHLWLQVLPRARGDHRRELEEALLRHRLEKAPQDFQAHVNLGALMISRLETQSAINEFERALTIDSASPEAHDMLGSALRSIGRSMEALEHYRLALHSDPNYVDARYNLATTLARAGDLDEAIAGLRQVVDAFPKSGRLHNELGELLARQGDLAAAQAEFDRALALEPANAYAAKNRDMVARELAARTRN